MQSVFKNGILQMLVVALATAVAGEFKIIPFSGGIFRIGLGSSTFLLFLLLMHHLSYAKTGFVTGMCVLSFRILEDGAIQQSLFSLPISLKTHMAAAVYYVVFGLGMHYLIQKKWQEFHPLLLGGVIAAIDFAANGSEIFVRKLLLNFAPFQPNGWLLLLAVAVVRSYFVVGIYSSISVNQMRSLHAEEKKRMEQMLNFGSGLYGEVFYLRKSMDAIEQITAGSYNLYSQLRDQGLKDFSQRALSLAQQIHEVKKDSQRILSGLVKLIDKEIVTDLNLSQILHYVVKANQQYSEMLKKEIVFEHDIEINYLTAQHIPLLSLLNNLVSNAVEAIDTRGRVKLHIFEEGDVTVFHVDDSGKGIAQQDKQIIFEPGFTTKFNDEGLAATGIGLSHVRDIVKSFDGGISVSPSGFASGTRFTVCLPTIKIRKGE